MENVFEKYKDRMVIFAVKAVEEGAIVAKDLLVNRLKTSGSKSSGGNYSAYSRTHKKRRENEGLQTSHKDFHYSGTMFENFIVTERHVSDTGASAVISFQGAAHRRSDQKSASNQQVAQWLSDYEGVSIVSLSESEKNKIAQRMIQLFGTEIQNITIDD